MNKDFLYKVKSTVIGHAIGDALGVPVEFASRKELIFQLILKVSISDKIN